MNEEKRGPFLSKIKESITEEKSIHSASKVRRSNFLLSYLHDLVFLIAGVLLFFSLLFRIIVVSGPSMKNTLVDGDWLLLLDNAFYHEYDRGDIVVISKKAYDNGTPIIKRVIATEGQTVDIDFDEGVVYVDGQPLSEEYTNTPTNLDEGVKFPLVVEEGCLFVLGDNRNESKDSRSPEIGLIDCREVLGKAVLLVFPGNEKGALEREFSRIGGIS